MTRGGLRGYRAIVSARFRTLLTYRAAALAGLWAQIFFGLVLIMIYEAFYRSGTAGAVTRAPLTLAQVVTYVWLGQALLAMLPWNSDTEIRNLIRSGGIAYELCRPLDLYALWFARAIALRTAPPLLRALPMALFAMFVLPLIGLPEWRLAPPTPGAALGFVVTLGGALLVSCAITTLIHITLMWTIAGEGIVMIVSTVVAFFAGLIVPLPLLPDWAQAAISWLPFATVGDQPYRIYAGDVPLAAVPGVLLRQLAWTAALVVLGRWLLARGVRRVVVQGG